jgi:hypothetical protein
VSAEGYHFPQRPEQPKYPALILRAYVGDNQFVEWMLTPPDNAGWFDYKFEARQIDGVLYINFDQSMMMPRAG